MLRKWIHSVFMDFDQWGWSSTLGIVSGMISEFYNLIPYYLLSKIWYRKFRDQFRDNSESRWPTSMSVCKVRPAALWVGMLKNGYLPSSLQISHGKKPYTFTHPTRVAKYCAPNEQNVGRPLHLLTKLSEHLTCLDAKPNSKYVHWYVLALCASTTRYSKK